MKKALFTTFILSTLLVLLVVGVQVVEVAKANPFIAPESPNKDPPIVTVDSLSYVGYGSRVASLSFTVTYPDSWSGNDYVKVDKVDYQLDDQLNIVLYEWGKPLNLSKLSEKTQFTATIYSLTFGQHFLKINVHSTSVYNPPPAPSWWIDPYHYHSTLTQKVPFTVDSNSSILLSFPLPNSTLTSYIIQASKENYFISKSNTSPYHYTNYIAYTWHISFNFFNSETNNRYYSNIR